MMRPPSMWEGVDDDVKTLRLGANLAAMPSSEIDLPAPRLDSGFKRTLSAVVEKDAERIAGMRKPSYPTLPARPSHMAKSTVPATRQMPMTSPPRGSISAVKGVRNNSRKVETQPAASSPGGYTIPRNNNPQHQTQAIGNAQNQQHEIRFDPNESPNTAINRILGTSMNMPMPSLQMPLSDDGRQDAQNAWKTDMSSFFDVENLDIQMSAGPYGATALKSPSPPPSFHRTSSSASRRRHQPSGGTEEDDVLSQLFHRTSSIGPLGSSPTRGAFDFSQLPPSSPPASAAPSSDLGVDIELELGHSALLLSSPDITEIDTTSPPDRTPHTQPHVGVGVGVGLGLGTGRRIRISPEKSKSKSSLNQSFTPQDIKQEPELEAEQIEAAPSYDFNDLWARLQYDAQGGEGMGMISSGEVAEGMLGSGLGMASSQSADDFLALFNSLTNSQ